MMYYVFITFIALILILFVLTAIHHVLLEIEKKRLIPNGKMVQIDNGLIHVYAKGSRREETPTVVIMSGSSMPSPTYNYKKLYDKFTDIYRIVVPEKFGYGYSDINDSPRDVKTILEQTRSALLLAGEKPPYVLVPHSMSGIEALLWAHEYPNEISAIIGLDMALPSHYEDMNLGFRVLCYKAFTGFVRYLGLQRLTLMQKVAGIYDKSSLSDREWHQEKYLIHKMTLNKMIFMESASIFDSAMFVKRYGVPEIPILFFISDGSIQKGWIEAYYKFIEDAPKAKVIELDCGHMMHIQQAEKISLVAKDFLAKEFENRKQINKEGSSTRIRAAITPA